MKKIDKIERGSMSENKIYNLKNDIIFKAFFSRKGNEEFLIDFLESLLNIKITKIEIKEDVNLEQLAVTEKGGKLDIQAILNDGIIANIEMQIKDRHNMEIRTTMYAAKIMSRDVTKGAKYEDLKKIVLVNILGYDIFPEYDDYIHKTAIVLDKHREKEVITNIEWWFIELPKFRTHHPDMNKKIDQWLAFIDDEDKELVKMAEKKNDTLKKAREEMNYLTGDAAIRRLAELREIWELDYNSGIDYAKNEGRTEGLIEGEKKAKIEMAKKLLELGIETDKILTATGLTQEELKKIIGENK